MLIVDPIERSVLRKLSLRLIPVLFFGVFLGYLDRVNVAFAALTMNDALRLTPTTYGWEAGAFFLGYLIFEIPGTMCLARFGSRRCMTVYMTAWGALSASMALMSSTAGLVTLRFFTGIAEAGFFPGTILYMSLWIPAKHRARIGSYFMLAIPLASVIGGPVSVLVLRHLQGVAGLAGWQWLFILEGLPALVLGAATFLVIQDRPQQAAWLTAAELRWLEQALLAARPAKVSGRPLQRLAATLNRRVLLLCTVQFACPAVAYGVTLWLPQVLRGFGLTIVQTGFVSALPFVLGMIAMWWWPTHSDRTGERRWHLTLAPLTSAVGLGLAITASGPLMKLVCLLIASLGMFSFLPLAWAVAQDLFDELTAPVGYAIISMSGALAGFVAPYVIGTLKERTGSFEPGILTLMGLGLAAACAAHQLFAPVRTVRQYGN